MSDGTGHTAPSESVAERMWLVALGFAGHPLGVANSDYCLQILKILY
jgi:hypothetical protein